MTARVCLLFVAVALSFGCKRESEEKPAAASASAAAAPSASAPVVQKPWYEGAWSGSYKAERYEIELPVGRVPAWSKDDGSAASGPGELKLTVDEQGAVTGTAKGALGPQNVRGQVIDESLRLELIPEEPSPETLRGAGLVERSGDAVKGELRASSGNSLIVRKASIELTKLPEG
jgi:hypothetical protein